MSPCIMETVSTAVSAGFLLLFGGIQFCIYLKYSTNVSERVSAAPRSKLYSLQKFLMIFVPLLATVRCILLAYFYEEPALYGYMVILVDAIIEII